MANKHYVYSTLSANMNYCPHNTRGDGVRIPQTDKGVLIRGGANVADKNFLTPKGVVTIVSDEQLAILNEDPIFNLHKENGFIVVESAPLDVETVVKNMEGADESAPLTPADYAAAKTTDAKPVVETEPTEVQAANTTKRRGV